MGHKIPSRPGGGIATHIFILKRQRLFVLIDYYSNLLEVDRLLDIKASATILKLKSYLARYGISDQVVGKNGL